MRQIKRSKLSKNSLSAFASWTALITTKPAPDQKQEAANQWESKSRNKPIKEARQKLKRMASGLSRCMYCEDSSGTDIDHFYPKSLYPNKTFLWENFILACSGCNSGQRSAAFPLDAQQHPLLIDPTSEDPGSHLILTPSTGKFRSASSSSKGDPTIDTFGLNSRSELVRGRLNAWCAVQSLIESYAQAKQSKERKRADSLRRAICEYPFSTILSYLLNPKYHRSVTAGCIAALQSCPEVAKWLS